MSINPGTAVKEALLLVRCDFAESCLQDGEPMCGDV